uniref:5-hydroxytryptamine receptor 3A-like n=1 Tax=Sinocyclocheilus grahami TaxID=75366 RepID=A0A672N2S8_SINGR
MVMILIRGRLQGGDLTPVSCAQFQDHLRFINVTSGREAYAHVFVHTFVFSESHLRTFEKLSSNKLRIVYTQHFINEAPDVLDDSLLVTFWNIEGLSWDPDECGTDRISLPRKKLWIPDIVINEFMDENKSPDTYYLYVQHTGKVMDDLPIHVISSCNMDIYSFPFDIQNCTFTFNSYKLTGKLARLRGTFSIITVVLSRRPTMYVVNLLIPSCFLIAVDLFSFLLPPQNVDRSAFKMTLILGYTVFLLLMNDLLPVTGNTLPLINVFFSLCLALMVASLLETILVTNIQCGSTHYGPLPQWAKVLFLNHLAKLNTFISTTSLVPVEHRTETKRCDPAFETHPSEATHKTPTLLELKKISHELLCIRQQVDKHFNDESTEEWMHLGQVIDRLLFCLYTVFLSVSFITVLVFWLYWYNK